MGQQRKITVMETETSSEWVTKLRHGHNRRIGAIRKARGIRPGTGFHIRFWGIFQLPDDTGYYVYSVQDGNQDGREAGLCSFELFTIDEERYRAATPEEVRMLMNRECPMVFLVVD